MERENFKKIDTPSADFMRDPPESAEEIINKYGTYNIQPTNDSAWEYPAIMQGLSHISRQHTEGERAAWKKEQAERVAEKGPND